MSDQQPKRILVVDDEVDVTWFLKECLERAGYAVETSNKPEEALERLLAEEFDVLVSDIRMPGMSGLDMVRLARAKGRALKALIFLTGNAVDDELVADAQKLGADLLSKPISGKQLRDAVAKVIAAANPPPRVQDEELLSEMQADMEELAQPPATREEALAQMDQVVKTLEGRLKDMEAIVSDVQGLMLLYRAARSAHDNLSETVAKVSSSYDSVLDLVINRDLDNVGG